MLTKDEIQFLSFYADDERMREIIKKHSKKPEVLITLEKGCYQSCAASSPVTIIIEDIDSIKEGGNLFYASPACDNEKNFDELLRAEHRKIMILHLIAGPSAITEARIFIHDKKDELPFNVMISKEVVATFKTFPEAAQFLAEIGEAIKNVR